MFSISYRSLPEKLIRPKSESSRISLKADSVRMEKAFCGVMSVSSNISGEKRILT
jgi:allophanate hydrolase subunit 1